METSGYKWPVSDFREAVRHFSVTSRPSRCLTHCAWMRKLTTIDRRMGGEEGGEGRGVTLLVTVQGIDCVLWEVWLIAWRIRKPFRCWSQPVRLEQMWPHLMQNAPLASSLSRFFFFFFKSFTFSKLTPSMCGHGKTPPPLNLLWFSPAVWNSRRILTHVWLEAAAQKTQGILVQNPHFP